MTNAYARKPSIFMNSALMSGAFVAAMTSIWIVVSVMVGA
jgi:hypothetical protein